MLHHGERINQEMTLSTGYWKLRNQRTPFILDSRLLTFQPQLILFNSKFNILRRTFFLVMLINMQHFSNDTHSWGFIVAPSASSASLYNSNAYDSIAASSATINSIEHPILSGSSLVSPHTTIIDTHSVNYWAFILIIFPLFTIFGNILVVISVYREKSLHTVTNYFVVSLAISDITVAAVVMPFAIYLEVS